MNTPATTYSSYGSITWWKDDDDAVFPGVGEINHLSWRNGSALPCTPTEPCLPLFSSNLPSYSSVSIQLPGDSTWHPLTRVSGDTWQGSIAD